MQREQEEARLMRKKYRDEERDAAKEAREAKAEAKYEAAKQEDTEQNAPVPKLGGLPTGSI